MQTSGADRLSVSWRTIAIGSLLLNAGAVAALGSILATGSDALATLALTLAVIAFICQLMIFTVQTWQSGQQLRQAEELNRSTIELVSDARARIENTHQMVSTQHTELLRLASLKVSADTAKGVSVPIAAAVTAAQVPSHPATAPGAAAVAPSDGGSPRMGSQGASDSVKRDVSWPAIEEAAAAIELLESIPHNARFHFVIDLADDIDSRASGLSPGLSLTDAEIPLIDMGLLRELGSVMTEGKTVRRVGLTDKGRAAGRVIAAPWPPPEELHGVRERIWAWRDSIKAHARAVLEAAVEEALDLK